MISIFCTFVCMTAALASSLCVLCEWNQSAAAVTLSHALLVLRMYTAIKKSTATVDCAFSSVYIVYA
jgi:hypothetical protein